MKDLTKLSDDALMEEWEKHSQAAADSKANARACSREVTRRRAEPEAKDKVGAMSEAERAALTQALHAHSASEGEAG